MTEPAVSVVMCVFNGERYLESAVNSVLGQTFKDFELVIVDDCSTDTTPQLMEELKARDSRIVICRTQTNFGPFGAANIGLGCSKAPLVARMDSDDLCHPERLERQVSLFKSRPDLMVCGTGFQEIGPNGQPGRRVVARPSDTFIIRWSMQFAMPFLHPSMMFRRLDSYGKAWRYDETAPYSLDYEFSWRVSRDGEAAIIGEPLMKYRRHPAQISTALYRNQMRVASSLTRKIQAAQIAPELLEKLEPFNSAFLDFEPTSPGTVISAMRQLVDHDVAEQPRHASELRRLGGKFIYQALKRTGHGNAGAVRQLALGAPSFVTAMARAAAANRISGARHW